MLGKRLHTVLDHSRHFSFISSSNQTTGAVADSGRGGIQPTSGSNRVSLTRVCKMCHRVYPFYKNECEKCYFKFPKTRGGLSAGLLHMESYVLQFWSKLHTEVNFFEQLTYMNDSLEESDFESVRDLYRKIK